MLNSKATLFLDGIIYCEQKFGGISRIWDEVIPRFPENGLSVNLLLPAFLKRNSHPVFNEINGINIQRDYFYWPKRYFEGNKVRSRFLRDFYKATNSRIFHSTYFTTIYTKDLAKFVTVPDLIYELNENRSSSKWDVLALNNKREAINNADIIVCISENTKKDLLHYYPLISESKVAVVYLGVPSLSGMDTINFEDAVPCSHIGEFKSRGYFLVVGNLDGYKNFQLILNLINKQPLARKFQYICVGSKKSSPTRFYAERNFSDNFIFLDYVTDQDLAIYYHNAIGLIYPSLYEGFGLPILEAMSNHCPVLCSNSSSLPEVGSDAAFYFDPRSTDELFNRLKEVISCDRVSVIAKGLVNCARFSWDRTTKGLLELYKEFL
jgi:glycosyltransferase involved in cell wall biosynthesis